MNVVLLGLISHKCDAFIYSLFQRDKTDIVKRLFLNPSRHYIMSVAFYKVTKKAMAWLLHFLRDAEKFCPF